MDVTLRRMTDDDLPMLHRWLNEPGVVRWWEGDDVSWDAVVADYGSGSSDPVECWIAHLDGRPVGWIQCYAIASFPDEDEVRAWRALGVAPTAGGIDYLLGDPADRGTGIGSAVIRAFVEDVVFVQHPAWTPVCASPVTANVASCRALARAGFTRVGEFTTDHGPATLYAREA